MYPSRRQSKSQNPLFAKTLRRRQLALMLSLILIGICVVVLQLIPVTAHADAKATTIQPAVPAASSITPAAYQTGKIIRQIQIYGAANN
jgi:hypothetical protein